MRNVALCLIGLSLTLQAAPPTLTSLFPAGGQLGTSFPMTLSGKLNAGKTVVWVQGRGVDFSKPDAKGKVTCTISKDAVAAAEQEEKATQPEAAQPEAADAVADLPLVAEVSTTPAPGIAPATDRGLVAEQDAKDESQEETPAVSSPRDRLAAMLKGEPLSK